MDELLQIGAFLGCGLLGLVLVRFIKKPSDKNPAVILKVEQIADEIEKLEERKQKNLEETEKTLDALEKEKGRNLTNEELSDFFNNRGKH